MALLLSFRIPTNTMAGDDDQLHTCFVERLFFFLMLFPQIIFIGVTILARHWVLPPFSRIPIVELTTLNDRGLYLDGEVDLHTRQQVAQVFKRAIIARRIGIVDRGLSHLLFSFHMGFDCYVIIYHNIVQLPS